MSKKNIDLSDIKENDLDKTSSYTDLMSRSERRNRNTEKKRESKVINDDIEDMIEEKKKNTKDLSIELESLKKEEKKEEEISNTQILDLTRKMRFNLEETKKENVKNSKNSITLLNIVGFSNLICIGFYIYLLVFTNYQDKQENYLLNGGLIIGLVLLFGVSVVSNKKFSTLFKILNIICIMAFIIFNVYTFLK